MNFTPLLLLPSYLTLWKQVHHNPHSPIKNINRVKRHHHTSSPDLVGHIYNAAEMPNREEEKGKSMSAKHPQLASILDAETERNEPIRADVTPKLKAVSSSFSTVILRKPEKFCTQTLRHSILASQRHKRRCNQRRSPPQLS